MPDPKTSRDEVRTAVVLLKTGEIEPLAAGDVFGVGLDMPHRELVLYLGARGTVRLSEDEAYQLLGSAHQADALAWVNGWREEIEDERTDPAKRVLRLQWMAAWQKMASGGQNTPQEDC